MANTAFQSITTRQSWYANEVVSAYDAVMIDTDGKFAKADGTRPFVGICEYGCYAAEEMITVVRGVYPGILSQNAAAGSLLTIDSTKPGQFKIAGALDKTFGTLLVGANAGDLAAIAMAETGVIGFDTTAAVVSGSLSAGDTYIAGTTTVSLATTTTGAAIKYRIGTTGDFLTYSTALATTGKAGTLTIQAYASKAGMADSAITTLVYEQTQVAEVIFTPADGEEYTAGTTTIALSCGTAGSTIKYRIGDSGEYSTYSEAIATTGLTDPLLIQAYATKTGLADSNVTEATFTAAA